MLDRQNLEYVLATKLLITGVFWPIYQVLLPYDENWDVKRSCSFSSPWLKMGSMAKNLHSIDTPNFTQKTKSLVKVM